MAGFVLAVARKLLRRLSHLRHQSPHPHLTPQCTLGSGYLDRNELAAVVQSFYRQEKASDVNTVDP